MTRLERLENSDFGFCFPNDESNDKIGKNNIHIFEQVNQNS